MLLSQAAVELMKRRPGVYARLREPILCCLLLLHIRVNDHVNLQLYSQWQHHGGSPWRLLFLILLSSSALWSLLVTLCLQPLCCWAAPVLMLSAAHTVRPAGRPCRAACHAVDDRQALAWTRLSDTP